MIFQTFIVVTVIQIVFLIFTIRTAVVLNQRQILLARAIFWHKLNAFFVSIILAIFALDTLFEQATQKFLAILTNSGSGVRVNGECVRNLVIRSDSPSAACPKRWRAARTNTIGNLLSNEWRGL